MYEFKKTQLIGYKFLQNFGVKNVTVNDLLEERYSGVKLER